ALAADLAHHLLHLLVLLEHAIDILYLLPRARGDTALVRPANGIGVTPFPGRHRIDDGNHAPGLAIVDLRLDCFGQVAHARQLVHQRAHAAELVHLQQLVAEVVEPETAAALADLAGQFSGLFLIDLALDFLDQAEHVAHAEDARSQAVRVKGL